MYYCRVVYVLLYIPESALVLIMKALEDGWYAVTSLPFLRFGLYYHILRVRAIPTLESTDSI